MKDKIMTETDRILVEVAEERQRQDEKWGGAYHDDLHRPLDWHTIISDYNGWARRMLCMRSLDKARKRFIQIAALAVAAVESIDRSLQGKSS